MIQASRYFCIALIFTHTFAHAMDSHVNRLVKRTLGFFASREEAPIDSSRCYIARLPDDIKNHIASYLTFHDRETDAEFIERTIDIPQGDEKTSIAYQNAKISLKKQGLQFVFHTNINTDLVVYNQKTKLHRTLRTYKSHVSGYPSTILFSCSPSALKIITSECTIESTRDSESDNICNIDVYSLIDQAEYTNFVLPHHLHALAITDDGRFFAYIAHKYNKQTHKNSYCLYLYNTSTETSQLVYSMSKFSTFGTAIAFNKQTTKIAITGNNRRDIINLVEEEEHQQKSQKRLIDYFRHRGVCKQWPQ